jgi:hypothetical protein
MRDLVTKKITNITNMSLTRNSFADEFSEKGKDFDSVERTFKSYLDRNPKTRDTILYRTAPINILKFWNWLKAH